MHRADPPSARSLRTPSRPGSRPDGARENARPGGRPEPAASLLLEPKVSGWTRFRRWIKPPRRLKFTREGKFFVGITMGVGFAAINTANNLLYLLLGMLLALIV